MNKKPTPIHTVHGSHHTPIIFTFKSRTEAQFEAVRMITQEKDYAFCCCTWNPFGVDIGSYTGPFAFVYYDTKGGSHLKKIGPSGQILKDITTPRSR